MRRRKRREIENGNNQEIPDNVRQAFVVLRSYMESRGGVELSAMEIDDDGKISEYPLKVVYETDDDEQEGQALCIGRVPVYFAKDRFINISVYRSTTTNNRGVFLSDFSTVDFSTLYNGKGEIKRDETKEGHALSLLRRKGSGLIFSEYFERLKRNGKTRASIFCSIDSLRRGLKQNVFTDYARDVIEQFFLTVDAVEKLLDNSTKLKWEAT